MLAVITLYYFPRLGLGFSYLLITLSKCYLLTIFLIFLVFIIITISIVAISFYFLLLISWLLVLLLSVLFFSFLLVCFVSYLYMVVDLFYVSNKKTSWFIFHICYLLWAYILCIVASLITFRFMNFDTDRLYIASLLNFDCNGHLDVVCVKLK